MLDERVGIGAFSEVFQGRWRGTKVAVKRLIIGPSREKGEVIREFRQEVTMLRKLRHPQIVLFMGATVQLPNLCVVTELLSGSVFDLLHNSRVTLSWTQRLQIALDTARGLNYLHHIPVIHRDLKSPNLLLDAQYRAKLCDFGLARRSSPDVMTGACGTFQWMAPEVMSSSHYSEKADVYSFAMIMWEVFARKVPFAGLIASQITLFVMRGKRPIIAPDCPKPFAQLMRKCWDAEPERRPTMDMVMTRLEHFLEHVSTLQLARTPISS
jgi:sterile alpha motif and leucine zipper-containing kinase AZK